MTAANRRAAGDLPARNFERTSTSARGKVAESGSVRRSFDSLWRVGSGSNSDSGRWVILVGFLLLVACGQRSKADHSKTGSDTLDYATMPLAARPNVVALADKLAAQGGRNRNDRGTADLLAAATLRKRLWRLEQHSADALEAVDLLEEAARRGSCQSAIDAALLGGEVEGNIEQTVKQLAAVKHDSGDAACLQRTIRVASVLGAGHLSDADTDSEGGKRETLALGSDVVAPQPVSTVAGETSRIVKIERYGAEDAARIVVLLDKPAAYQVGFLRDVDGGLGARLYIDVNHARYEGPSDFDVGGLVRRVRVGERAEGVRLVLDLQTLAFRRIFYVPEPFRLIVDVFRQSVADAIESAGPRQVRRVVIDPGHGGHDPGAIGPRGLREKDVTLDIAHRAAPLIARELGIATLLTRDVDVYVPLDERTARANAFRADLFISIHCNATLNTGSDGVVTFVLDKSSDSAASRVAALENSASASAANELASALGSIQDEAIVRRSVHFAELLQRSTMASLAPGYGHIPDQGVRRAGFYVLAGAHMPAVLYEVSFISNPKGEVRLNTVDYRQKLANSVVNAVRAYRDGL